MRRRFALAVLMTTLCLLCACGGKETDPLRAPMDFRTRLLAEQGCSFVLEARAQSGDRLWALGLDCRLDETGDGAVTVLAPESIAGITALLRDGSRSLRYEELCLGLGTLPGTELAPAAAPGQLVRAWSEAWIASAGADETGLLVCYEADPLQIRTWFDPAGLPLRAEIFSEGSLCFSGEIRNFAWKSERTNEAVEENLG